MKNIILTLVAILSFAFIMTPAVSAVDVFDDCSGDAADTAVCKASKTDKLFGAGSIWNSLLNVLTYVIGAIAVLMLIIGGLRYATSGGDPASVTGAKNTILYAVIGIVVAASANAFINFVLTNI